MPTPPPPMSRMTAPADVAVKFPELVDLILGSKSMADDERAYWFKALPTMNAEQIATLKDILTTEHQQIQAIERKYSQQLSKEDRAKAAQEFSNRQQQMRDERRRRESRAEKEEKEVEEQILGEIEEHE